MRRSAMAAPAAAITRTLPRHVWPAREPLLQSLEQDPDLRPIHNPILHTIEEERPEGAGALSYISDAPKVLARAFWDATRNEGTGAAIFTQDAAGSPNAATSGAVAALFDNIIGVVGIEMTGRVMYTVSLDSRFHRSVPLDTALPWRVWVAAQTARRVTLCCELLRPDGSGPALCSFEAVFAVTGLPFPAGWRRSAGGACPRARVYRVHVPRASAWPLGATRGKHNVGAP